MKRFWNAGGFPLAGLALTLVLLFTGQAIGTAYGAPALFVTLFFWMLGMLPLAVSFYRLRRRQRLVYGLFELVASCAIFYVTMLAISRGIPAGSSR
jgi:hypothetical protein